MRYKQERKASEEILRLIIGKMAAHPAAFTPHTYAVWYEYLMGTNSGLTRELNQLIEDNGLLDDGTVHRLYQSHISECSNESSCIHEEIRNLLGKVIDVTAEADIQAVSFGNNLRDYGDQLKVKPNLVQQENLLKKIAGDAEIMHTSMTHLHDELERSQQEIGNLRKDLDSARLEALIDPLTGIYNRRGFEREVQRIFADDTMDRNGACVLMIDIDNFKQVNDKYGHLFGDRVIYRLANDLKSKVRGRDLVARLGGEEFAILLPDTMLEDARTVAENIRSGMEKGRIRGSGSVGHDGSITVSIGVASYRRDQTFTECLDQADKALYASKNSGRNRVTVYGFNAAA
ncbi:MAG TPA: GGDEF domain-containing protein [Burkholderiales bacterium]|nr:GGDEF domain-containing protein [Burkholderiales bacterium]